MSEEIANDGIVLEIEMRGITDVRGLLFAVKFAWESSDETYGLPVPEWLEKATD